MSANKAKRRAVKAAPAPTPDDLRVLMSKFAGAIAIVATVEVALRTGHLSRSSPWRLSEHCKAALWEGVRALEAAHGELCAAFGEGLPTGGAS